MYLLAKAEDQLVKERGSGGGGGTTFLISYKSHVNTILTSHRKPEERILQRSSSNSFGQFGEAQC